jgi:hypothetical protein
MIKTNLDLLGKVVDTAFLLHKKNVPGVETFIESFRPNQIKCKSWLVEHIANTNAAFDKVLVVGSWNSVLLYELMQENCDVGWYDFLDNDKKVHTHRDIYFDLNKINKNYNSILYNADDFSDFEDYDLIINTSCEHMKPMPVVHGPLYALQSNNYTTIKEHINCVNSTKELKDQYNINQIVYEDECDMGHYKRFMVLGSHW